MIWANSSDTLYFLTNKEGRSQLHRYTPKKDHSEILLDIPQTITLFRPSPKKEQIALVIQDHDPTHELFKLFGDTPRNAKLHLFDLKDRTLKPLTDSSIHIGSIDYSPDGEFIVFDYQTTALPEERILHSKISTIHLLSGEITQLTTKRSKINPKFSPDGQWIAYMATPGTWEKTYHINVIDNLGKKEIPLALTPDEQANIVGWLPDSKSLIVRETERTTQRLYQLSLDSEKIIAISPSEILVTYPSLSANCERVAFRSETSDMPCEVFISPVKNFEPIQISQIQTHKNYPKLKTELVMWKAKDGLAIEGILTYPSNANLEAPYPLIVLTKGVTSPTFNTYTGAIIKGKMPYSVGVFAHQGYAVLRPYYRGSYGYGRQFRNAIDKDWGIADFEDILSGIDYLIDKGIVDPKHIGITGWGYGGFLTASAITKSDRFTAASVGGGITNFISFTGTTNTPKFMPYYVGSNFWENDRFWISHSPIHHVMNIKTPTLIQHCEGDSQVPPTQSAELYNALKIRNIPSKFILYSESEHFIKNPKIILEGLKHNLEWFHQYL